MIRQKLSGRSIDLTPDSFTFNSIVGANNNTQYTSAYRTVSGLEPNTSVLVSVTGFGNSFTVGAGNTFAAADAQSSGLYATTSPTGTLIVRTSVTTSSGVDTEYYSDVTVGDGTVVARFSVRTAAADLDLTITTQDVFTTINNTESYILSVNTGSPVASRRNYVIIWQYSQYSYALRTINSVDLNGITCTSLYEIDTSIENNATRCIVYAVDNPNGSTGTLLTINTPYQPNTQGGFNVMILRSTNHTKPISGFNNTVYSTAGVYYPYNPEDSIAYITGNAIKGGFFILLGVFSQGASAGYGMNSFTRYYLNSGTVFISSVITNTQPETISLYPQTRDPQVMGLICLQP